MYEWKLANLWSILFLMDLYLASKYDLAREIKSVNEMFDDKFIEISEFILYPELNFCLD